MVKKKHNIAALTEFVTLGSIIPLKKINLIKLLVV